MSTNRRSRLAGRRGSATIPNAPSTMTTDSMLNTNTNFELDVAKKIKQGLCPRCGIQTHRVMLGGLKKVPLDNGNVRKGRCLKCNPTLHGNRPSVISPSNEEDIMQNHHQQHPTSGVAVRGAVPKFVRPPGDEFMTQASQSSMSEMSEITMNTFATTKRDPYRHARVNHHPSSQNFVRHQDHLTEEDEDDILPADNSGRTQKHENKIRIEEPLENKPSKALPLFSQNRSREPRDRARTVQPGPEVASPNKYDRINEGKIRIEEPLRRPDGVTKTQKALPLFGGRRGSTVNKNVEAERVERTRSRDIDEDSTEYSPTNTQTVSRLPRASMRANNDIRRVSIIKRTSIESDTEPGDDEDEDQHDLRGSGSQTIQQRTTRIPQRARTRAEKQTSNRPKASVPGVVREGPSSNNRIARKVEAEARSRPIPAQKQSVRPIPAQKQSADTRRATSDDEIPAHLYSIVKELRTMTGVHEIIAAMHNHYNEPKVQEIACMKIRNLSADSSYVSAIDELDGIEKIVQAMEDHESFVNVQEQGCAVIWCLASLNDSNKESIMSEGGIHCVIKALKNYSSEKGIAVWGCGALFSLSFNKANKVFIGSSGGISEIIDAMNVHSGTVEIQEIGTSALCSLSQNCHSNAEAIISGSGLSAALQGVEVNGSQFLERSCCILMANMLACRIGIEKIVTKSAVDVLMNSLTKSNDDLEYVVSVLTVLATASKNPQCSSFVGECPCVVEAMMSIMLEFSSNETIQEKAVCVLARAASVDSSRFQNSRAISLLLKSFSGRSYSMSMYVDVSQTLLILVSSDPTFVQSVKMENGVKTLVLALRKPLSARVQENICAILSTVSVDADVRDEILTSGGLKVISRIMRDKASNLNLMIWISSLLYSLSFEALGKKVIISEGLVMAIINTMKTHQSDHLSVILHNILWNLSVDNSAEVAPLVCDADGISSLLSASMSESSTDLVLSSCNALWGLTADSKFRRELDINDGIDSVLNIISAFKNNEEIQEKSIGILANMCVDRSSADKLKQVNGIRTLVRTANHHMYLPKIQRIICIALRNIAETNESNRSAICDGGGIEVVINAILNVRDSATRMDSCACLRSLAGSSNVMVKSQIVQLGGIDALMEVMDEHPTNEALQNEACATIPLLSGAADFQIVLVPRSSVEN